MPSLVQSKPSPHFTQIDLCRLYNRRIGELTEEEIGAEPDAQKDLLLTGANVLRGIPFGLGDPEEKACNVVLLKDRTLEFVPEKPIRCRYLLFLHVADYRSPAPDADGIFRPMRGVPILGDVAAEYALEYADGTRHVVPIRRRCEIGEPSAMWGAGTFIAVPHRKPDAFRTNTEDVLRGQMPAHMWGRSQTRATANDPSRCLWIYALENPEPRRPIHKVVFSSGSGVLLLLGMTATNLKAHPLRWEMRKKAVLGLPRGETADAYGDYPHVDIDMGRVISVMPQFLYDQENWEETYNNQPPERSDTSVVVEYTCHPGARFYLGEDGRVAIPAARLEESPSRYRGFQHLRIAPARREVRVQVLEKGSGKTVPAKIHIHGEAGEYLSAMHLHRIPNPHWFEDFSPEFVHGAHWCSYIDGDARFLLPDGMVYVEVSKGFEIRPIRRTFRVGPETEELVVQLEHVLPWRERGWVTADTHVHFLSPHTAHLEGKAEGVNVVNLLTTQLGELFTNVGDFDGRTTLGSREMGEDGEYLVRVGTENRQHILGHISLIGYEGDMILPLTTGGPDESALGDPVAVCMSQWAKQCREQNGIVVLPHFPNPRCEGAAVLVLERADGIEMTSWGDLYTGINPYSLSDWYRYLNCGYRVPAVGGTDKMSANTAVGTVRTYARIEDGPFTYDAWKDAVRAGRTFATYGPLLEFSVEGHSMGDTIDLPAGGGTLNVAWKVSTVTVPVVRVEIVVNGEIRETFDTSPEQRDHEGSASVKMEGGGWIALRVRGKYPDRPEMIAAHSSPVMVKVGGDPYISCPDAMTILDQIEGAMSFVETIGTHAEEQAYRKLMMTLTAAHRALHNRMHRSEIYHHHVDAR